MLALEQLAFSKHAPTWQHIKLMFLFQQLFASNEFQTLVLFYNNSTIDMANLLLYSFAKHELLYHDFVTYNIDRHLPAPIPFVGYNGDTFYYNPSLVPRTLVPCFSRSVSVEVFDDPDSLEVSMFRLDVYLLHPQTRWIRIYMRKARYFLNDYRYMAMIELIENDELRLSTFNFLQKQPLELFADTELTVYQQLFFNQRIDMLGKRLLMVGAMDVPNLFRATAFDAEGHLHIGVSGMYASICMLIADYFNATILFVKSGWHAQRTKKREAAPFQLEESNEKYVEYERLKERVYRATCIMPGVETSDEPCSLFDEYSAKGSAMYPHRQENYVVLVPNERQHSPELWMLISASPLTSVWLSAIVAYTLMRFVILLTKRRGIRRFSRGVKISFWDMDRVLLETCGLAFGFSVAVRPCGRADRVTILSISLFAIVSSVFCSGLLMKQFAFGKLKPKIDTLGDLIHLPNMTVMMPDGLVLNESTWNANHTLTRTSLHVIYGEILRKNVRCTYVLPESVADVLLSEPHMSEDDGAFPVFHKLRERVLSKHMSMYSNEDIIKYPLNQLIQRMHYMGLISYFEQQIQLVLQVRESRATESALAPQGAQTAQSISSPTSSTSITLREIGFIVWMVFVGQVCSLAMFGLELLVARIKMQYTNRK